jgi:hypothetical protein
MKHVFFRVSEETYEAWAVIAAREGRSVPNLVKWWATQSGLDDELAQLAPRAPLTAAEEVTGRKMFDADGNMVALEAESR